MIGSVGVSPILDTMGGGEPSTGDGAFGGGGGSSAFCQGAFRGGADQLFFPIVPGAPPSGPRLHGTHTEGVYRVDSSRLGDFTRRTEVPRNWHRLALGEATSLQAVGW